MAIFPLPADLTADTALTEIYASIWDLLESSAAGNAPGWRLPVLATLTDRGCEQRTVVLRVVDRDQGTLLFHTDVRSSKVEQIRKDGRVSLLFYDHEQSVQLKIRGVAAIHQADEFAQSLWEAGTPVSLKMYSAPMSPGTQCDSFNHNMAESLLGRLPERNEIEAGRINFCAIRILVQSAEWLRLSQSGHLRTSFALADGRLLSAGWIAP
jgi:pyridoxine/pyridoxamine 5'-phosphate oxidase